MPCTANRRPRRSRTPPGGAWSRRGAAEILGVPASQIDAAIRRGEHVRIADSALRRFAGQDPLRDEAA